MNNRNWLAIALLYLSVAVAVFITTIVLTGMVAYFAKTFYHIPSKWLFGLFD